MSKRGTVSIVAMFELFHTLKTTKRDNLDVGLVVGNHDLSENVTDAD